MPSIIKENKRVVYNGDNYSEAWHKEAEKRGLPNMKNTVDTLPVVVKKETIDLLTKYKVYTEKELQSRFTILAENYVKAVMIEGSTAALIAKTQILPAAIKFQKEVGESVAAAKAAGASSPGGVELLSTIVSGINDLTRAIATLDKALNHHAEGDALAHARHARDGVLASAAELRKVADKLENIIPDELWPLPTYREMLFIK